MAARRRGHISRNRRTCLDEVLSVAVAHADRARLLGHGYFVGRSGDRVSAGTLVGVWPTSRRRVSGPGCDSADSRCRGLAAGESARSGDGGIARVAGDF